VSAILSDFLVIGGGVVGISIALELKRRHPGAGVCLLEKEAECGLHASGRNSGVIHAGFYYSADSLKAKFTRAGNIALTAYCKGKNIPLNRCGKLVVARNAAELPQLDELLRRGAANGVPLESLSDEEAKKIEPRVKTFQRAIFSPTTSSASPQQVIATMREDAAREGVRIFTGAPYLRSGNNTVFTPRESFEAGHVVNAAGLYADRMTTASCPSRGFTSIRTNPGTLSAPIFIRCPICGTHFSGCISPSAPMDR
jgi:(S)-2-hydroxyglutarate dehydrogenase